MTPLEMFRCVPLACKLTRKACASRSGKEPVGSSQWGKKGGSRGRVHSTCEGCPVGAAHARGETATTWPDGEPIELVGPIVHRDIKPQNIPKEVETMDDATKTDPRNELEEIGEILEGTPLSFRWRGRVGSISYWAGEPECHPSESTLRMRIQAGWLPCDALLTPTGEKRLTRGPMGKPPEAEPDELEADEPEETGDEPGLGDPDWRLWATHFLEEQGEELPEDPESGTRLRARIEDMHLDRVADALAEVPATIPPTIAGLEGMVEERDAMLKSWREWARSAAHVTPAGREALDDQDLRQALDDDAGIVLNAREAADECLRRWRAFGAQWTAPGEELNDVELRKRIEAQIDGVPPAFEPEGLIAHVEVKRLERCESELLGGKTAAPAVRVERPPRHERAPTPLDRFLAPFAELILQVPLGGGVSVQVRANVRDLGARHWRRLGKLVAELRDQAITAGAES